MFFRYLPTVYFISKYLLGFSLLFITIGNCTAQKGFSDLVDATVTIKSDARIDSLVMRHIRVNEVRDGFDGYRVQIYSGSGNEARKMANDLRAEFLTQYPDVPAYLIYKVPNFKVRVGDLRTELEAIRLQRELSYLFPGGFVVRDEVKFPILSIDKEIVEVEEEEELDGQ